MLPFLKPKNLASVIIAKRKPSGEIEPKHEENKHDPALMSCAEDLIKAVHAKDAEAVADAIKSAFEVMDSMSDEESTEE